MADEFFKRVLIIEDDVAYRSHLGDFLSAHSFTVSMADNGEAAMEKILFHKPHLVILDLLLPKLHGFEVLKRIRGYPDKAVSETPVIVLSNLSSDKDIETAKSLGISAYLVKSNTTNEDVLKQTQEILYKGQTPPDSEVLDFRDMTT